MFHCVELGKLWWSRVRKNDWHVPNCIDAVSFMCIYFLFIGEIFLITGSTSVLLQEVWHPNILDVCLHWKTSKVGVPGGLRCFSVWRLVSAQVMISHSWDWTLHLALCWPCRACLGFSLCLSFSLPLPCSLFLSLKINELKKNKTKQNKPSKTPPANPASCGQPQSKQSDTAEASVADMCAMGWCFTKSVRSRAHFFLGIITKWWSPACDCTEPMPQAAQHWVPKTLQVHDTLFNKVTPLIIHRDWRALSTCYKPVPKHSHFLSFILLWMVTYYQ